MFNKMLNKILIIAFLFHFPSAFSQNVVENIGFGQPSDSTKEGESDDFIRIRLEPNSISTDVFGHIVPLSLSQYINYSFITPRAVPQSVQEEIDDIVDPAECMCGHCYYWL